MTIRKSVLCVCIHNELSVFLKSVRPLVEHTHTCVLQMLTQAHVCSALTAHLWFIHIYIYIAFIYTATMLSLVTVSERERVI